MHTIFSILKQMAFQLRRENLHHVALVVLVLIFAGSLCFWYFEKTLGFFDELVSLLATGAQGADSYPATGRVRKGALPLIYSKEV